MQGKYASEGNVETLKLKYKGPYATLMLSQLGSGWFVTAVMVMFF